MKLEITKTALKGLAGMPAKDRKALLAKIETFAANPNGKHSWAKAFDTTSGRLRHGDWRALYDIDKGVLVVRIVDVRNRKEAYR